MAEVEEECTFHTRADQVKFFTQTNGDKLNIKNLKLSQNQATSLTWLINADNQNELEWQVKVKER